MGQDGNLKNADAIRSAQLDSQLHDDYQAEAAPKKIGRKRENLINRKFEMLTVCSKAEDLNRRSAWVCRCECGKTRIVRGSDLKSGRVWCCGCRSRRGVAVIVDMAGSQFGRLTALSMSDRRDRKGSVYWKCRCSCGNVVEVPQDRLVSGNTTSCGCLKKEWEAQIKDTLHFVDGTCMEWLKSRKSRCDNTSGFRGVSRLKSRYRVSIGLQGHRYYLGTYRNFEEAKRVRLEAEEHLHNALVKQWSKWCEKAETDQQWAKIHPFRFNVIREQGKLVIRVQNWDEKVFISAD